MHHQRAEQIINLCLEMQPTIEITLASDISEEAGRWLPLLLKALLSEMRPGRTVSRLSPPRRLSAETKSASLSAVQKPTEAQCEKQMMSIHLKLLIL